jgi:hypothetical protein
MIISYRLEPGAQVELSWQLPLSVASLEIQVPGLASMRFEASSLGAVESVEGWQVVHGKDLPADRAVSVTLVNVPAAAELFTDDASVLQVAVSYQITEFMEQANGIWAGVWQLCELANNGRRIYRNTDGIYLSMPRNFAGMPQLGEGNGPDVSLVPLRGVGVTGPVPPGGRAIRFGYFLPVTGGTLVHTQHTSTRIDSYSVAAIERGGMKIGGPGLGPAEERPGGHGVKEKILVAFGTAPVAADDTFTFTLSGLPADSTRGPLGATIAGGLFALGAIVAGERWRRAKRRQGDRSALEQDRERMFGELVALEAGHREGSVADEAYQSRRASLVSRLESVTLELSGVS